MFSKLMGVDLPKKKKKWKNETPDDGKKAYAKNMVDEAEKVDNKEEEDKEKKKRAFSIRIMLGGDDDRT